MSVGLSDTADGASHLDPSVCLGGCLESVLGDPGPRFLFVADPCGLTESVAVVEVRGLLRPLIRYSNHLDLRDRLADLNDVPLEDAELPLAIVAFGSHDWKLAAIADLASRATLVSVAPSGVLAHVVPAQEWPRSLDMLRGADFWDLAERMVEARTRWGDALTSSSAALFVGECRVGRALRGKIPGSEAIDRWESIQRDLEMVEFLGRYPDVQAAVERAVLGGVHTSSRMERDPEYCSYLWMVYFMRRYAPGSGLLLGELLDQEMRDRYASEEPSRLSAALADLLAQDPLTIVGQLRAVERALAEDAARERRFLQMVGLGGDRAVRVALRIAADEKLSGYLTERALRVLIPHVASPASVVSQSRLRQVLRTLESEHVASRFPRYFPRLTESIGVFKSVLDLSAHMATCHARGWDRNLGLVPVQAWMEEVFPDHLSPMRTLCDGLSRAPESVKPLLQGRPTDLLSESCDFLARADEQFSELVKRNYVQWISRQQPPPLLTVDFLDGLFLPTWRRLSAAYKHPLGVICLLHGVRWDEWGLLDGVFREHLTRHRRDSARPLLGLLPTSRPYNTAALILGRFPSLSDTGTVSHLLEERLAAEGIGLIGTTSTPNLAMPKAREGVVLANVALPETGARKTRPTVESRVHLLDEAANALSDFLAQIPPKALVVVVSNGGTTEVAGPAVSVPRGALQVERRWIGLDAQSDETELPPNVVYLNAPAIHLPNPHVGRCAFAPRGMWFARDDRTTVPRYLSGGISLEEMMLPCAVYLPRRGPGNLRSEKDRKD